MTLHDIRLKLSVQHNPPPDAVDEGWHPIAVIYQHPVLSGEIRIIWKRDTPQYQVSKRIDDLESRQSGGHGKHSAADLEYLFANVGRWGDWFPGLNGAACRSRDDWRDCFPIRPVAMSTHRKRKPVS